MSDPPIIIKPNKRDILAGIIGYGSARDLLGADEVLRSATLVITAPGAMLSLATVFIQLLEDGPAHGQKVRHQRANNTWPIWRKDDVLDRRRLNSDIDHLPFDPLCICGCETPESGFVSDVDVGGLFRLVASNNGDNIYRIAQATSFDQRLRTYYVREDSEWVASPWESICLLRYINKNFNMLRPVSCSSSSGVTKKIERMSGRSWHWPPMYALTVDPALALDALRPIVFPEENMNTLRIAVVGGDSRIFRQDWPSHLDIRPFVPDNVGRIVTAHQNSKLDAIVVLGRFINHSTHDRLKSLVGTPTYLWKRGLPELAKALHEVHSLENVAEVIRRNSTNGVGSLATKAPDVVTPAPSTDVAVVVSPEVMATWEALIYDALALEACAWSINDIVDVLDAQDHREDIAKVAVALVRAGKLIAIDDKFGLAEPPPITETPVLKLFDDSNESAPTETEAEMAKLETVPTVKAETEGERMLISWQEQQNGVRVSHTREVLRENAPNSLSSLLSGDDPKVEAKSVRLWREVKIKTKVRIEVEVIDG